MKFLPTLSPKNNRVRVAAIFLGCVISVGVPFQTASAGDALTTATTSTVGKGILGSLFKSKSTTDSTTATPVSATDRINKSILALPFGIVRGVAKGVSKMAGKVVTDHITHN